MRETQAIIERVRRVNDGYQRLELAVDDYLLGIKPGQSVLARLDNTWHPYLREHWWPVSMGQDKLVIERPLTETYEPSQTVSLLGLVGQPFRFRKTLRNVMLLAYDTPPTPLLMTIPWLLGNNISVTVVLLGTARSYDTRHLSPEVEVLRGADPTAPPEQSDDPDMLPDPEPALNWDEQVTSIGNADQVFAIVGQDDEALRFESLLRRFQYKRKEVAKNYLFGVFQPPLPCGSGACHSCMLRNDKGTSLICTEGPAFDLTQVKLL